MPNTASPCSTATILSSASLPSIMRSPPMGMACTRMSPCEISFSVSTQTSMGSPSPRMPGRPVRSEQKAPTRSAQSVRGMKP